MRAPAFGMAYVYVEALKLGSLLPAPHCRRNRYAPTKSVLSFVRRNRYALVDRWVDRRLAEVGTPQKRVRLEAEPRLPPAAQKRVRCDGLPRCDVVYVLHTSLCFPLNPLCARQRRRNGYAGNIACLWISLCNAEVIPAESGSGLALKRVRVYADSGSRLRRIEYAAPQNRVRTGSV